MSEMPISLSDTDNVKLLGVNIDNKLSFNEHITFICRRDAKQLSYEKYLHKKTR